MKLILVRHAQTEANENKINQGDEHGDLTQKGKSQTKQVAAELEKYGISKIYASDLRRAKETADEILKKTHTPIEYVKDLRERKLGEFEGKSYGSFKNYVQENKLHIITFRPKGGESIKDSFDRVHAFFKKCAELHKDETILWVSHGSVIKRLVLHYVANQKDNKDYHPDNCSINIIEMDEKGKFHSTIINKTDHLIDEIHEDPNNAEF